MAGLAERLGLTVPVVQAGMGGGLATAPLAGAVSAAGGLGTVGILPPAAFGPALREARERAGRGRPVAANLLVPFTKDAHVAACLAERVEVVVLHAGRAPAATARLRGAGIEVLATVGTAAEARTALADGASGLVAQGVEAGGHLVGVRRTPETLAEILGAAGGAPVWAAGGVAEAADVRTLLDAGADAVVAGTRFVATDECGAHTGYKDAITAAGGDATRETVLFGVGWPMRHRVLVNDAVRRWGEGPAAVRAVAARSGGLGARLPLSLLETMARLQHPAVPVLGPGPALAGMPDRVLRATPLYAGESVGRVGDVVPAAEALRRLADG